MGNHRFRLSDMMPNAWFYKLRDMSKLKNHNPSHPINKNLPSSIQNPRKSFYYTTDHNSIRMDNNLCKNPKFFDTPFPYDPPRKSKKLKSKRKTIYMPSPRKIIFQEPDDSSVGLQHGPGFDVPTSDDDQEYFLESLSEFDDDHSLDDGHDQSMSSCSCSKLSSSATDIIIDMDESYSASTFTSINIERFAEFTELPPIVTKPGNKESPKLKNKNTSAEFPTEKVKRNRTSSGGRKSVSGGVKIQGKGRRSKKVETGRRKSVKCGEKKAGMFYSESFAIVKASLDPEKDFRESMMEMIVENNIRESKDLEDLLACYLSLNSNQYHHLIIKSFEQIWFNMPRLQF